MSMLGSVIDTPLIWSKHVKMQIDKAEALASKEYAPRCRRMEHQL
jgi:hypothetical protein